MLRSKITVEGQTTVPSAVRKAIGVGPGDEIGYIIDGSRAVLVKAQDDDQGALAANASVDLDEPIYGKVSL